VLTPDGDWFAAHLIDGDAAAGYVVACPTCNERAKGEGGSKICHRVAPLADPGAPSLTEPGFANLVTGARAMTRADNRGLAGIPSAVLGLFVAGNLLVVVIGLPALVGAGVLEALTRGRA
jgi:hypothetical protein